MTEPRIWHRLRRARRAESALEFALIGTVLILMLLAPVEIGLMIWTGSALRTTAAETARCVAIGGSACANPQSYAVDLAKLWIGPHAITTQDVTVSATTTCHNATGSFAQVSITASIWSGTLLSPIAVGSQTATACFPS